MRRIRKTKEEVLAARRDIQQRAAEGRLALPSAIREIRNALDMTQDEFARAFQLTRQQVVTIESGKSNPTIDTLRRIVRPFRLTLGVVPMPSNTESEPTQQSHE